MYAYLYMYCGRVYYIYTYYTTIYIYIYTLFKDMNICIQRKKKLCLKQSFQTVVEVQCLANPQVHKSTEVSHPKGHSVHVNPSTSSGVFLWSLWIEDGYYLEDHPRTWKSG